MNPLAAPSVSSGSGLVNAQTLDSQIFMFASKVNEIVAVVNQAFPDGVARSGSAEWRTVAQEARDSLEKLAVRISAIRKQFEPKLDTTAIENVGGSFTVPGSSTSLYRLLMRVRLYTRMSAYAVSAGGAPIQYADGLTDGDLAGLGAWRHSQRIVSFPEAVAAFGIGASHDRATIEVSSPRRLYVLNYISKDGSDIPAAWKTPPLDDQLIEVWAHGGATISITSDTASISILSVSASPTSGEIPLTVDFDVEVSGGTPPYSYNWNFDDGGSSTDKNPSHDYLLPGIFSPTVVVSDAAGHVTEPEAPAVIAVTVAPLTIDSAVASPSSGDIPLSVSFSASISGGIPPYTYLWDFGDGNTSTDSAPTHEYADVGVYSPSLTVSDSQAVPDTDSSSTNTVEATTSYVALGFWMMDDTDCTNRIAGSVVGSMNTSYYNPSFPTWPWGTLTRDASNGYTGGCLESLDLGPDGKVRSAKTGVGQKTLTKFTFGGFVKSTECGPTFAIQGQDSDEYSVGVDASTNRTSWKMYDYSSNISLGNPPIATDRYQHVAVTVNLVTGSYEFFIDGVSVASGVNAWHASQIVDPVVRINTNSGAYYPYSGGYFDNWFLCDGIMPVEDIAKLASGWGFDSTGTLVEDLFLNDVIALLHLDGADGSTTITESSGTNPSWAAYDGAALDDGIKKFGSASLDLASGQVRTGFASEFNLGSGDYTMEMWIRPTGDAYDRDLICKANAPGGFYGFRFRFSVGVLGFVMWDGSNYYVVPDGRGAGAVTLDAWHHVAGVREGSNLSLYVDGNRVGQISCGGASMYYTSGAPVSLGSYYGIQQFSGRIDEVRVTKAARYSGLTYTIPTAAFPDP